MRGPFTPGNWFWRVGATGVWSSLARNYINETDPAFVAFTARGFKPTPIASEAELSDVLRAFGLPGLTPTASDVVAERVRRLAAGFDYTFGDERGVHRVGTTEQDLAGWREVSDVANAAIAVGQPNTQIAIVTDTGAVTVTALEWQSILLAAAQFRQPIWAASFALQAASPIPAGFRSDTYWQI